MIQEKKHKQGGIWEMITIAFPIVVANASETVLIFTDRIFMSKLGAVTMNAALGGGLSVYMMMTFFIGLTGYTTALSAQYLGAGEKANCSKVTTQALIIAVLAYPIILAAKPLAHLFFRKMGVSEEQLGLQIQYFDLLLYIVLFSLLKNSLNGFFSGVGKTRIVMISSLVTMSFNVLFNYILVFGKFGFPAMGMIGAAYGSILASFLGLVVLLIEYFSPRYSEYAIGKSFVFDAVLMKKLLRFGTSPGVEMFLNIFAFTAMVFIFQSVSPMVATASSIVFNWDMVAYVPLIGIEIGVTSLVGRYMGMGLPDIAARATKSGIYFGLIYSAILFVLFIGFPEELIRLFKPAGDEALFEQAVPTAVNMLRLISLYVAASVLTLAYVGALRGAGDTLWAMVLTVSLHWAFLPVVYIILHVLHWPAEAAWLSVIVIFYLFIILLVRRYRQGKWRELRIVSQ